MKNRTLSLIKRALALALSVLMLLSVCVTVSAAEEKKFILSENFAKGQAVTANNSYGSQPKESAVDSDRNTIWRTLSSCADSFVSLIIPFGEETDVNLVYLKPYMYDRMTSVKIQYTTDPAPSANSEWVDAKVFEKNEISDVMTAGFDTVAATGVRFYADVTQQYAGLYEIELYYTNDAETAIDRLINAKPTIKEFTQPEYVDVEIVSVDENGKLIYKEYDENGAKLIDFSRVGYKRGEEPIPDVKVVKTIDANYRADHTSLIQDAINEVAALPESERGAILLKAGKYTITKRLNINASGIVLRGEGQGEDGTVIYDMVKNTSGATVVIKGAGSYTKVPNTKTTLADSCVVVGDITLGLADASQYNAGDNILVTCTPNNLWIQTLGMDKIPGDGVEQWKASEYVMTYERTVTAVDKTNNTVTIDTGIPLTLDNRYYAVTVDKIADHSGRITGCGIENLRLLSYYDQSVVDADGNYVDEKHGWTAVRFENCRDCFARDVSAKHYGYSTVTVASGSINVTVEGCSYLEPVSLIQGSRRYSFYIGGGQYILFKNCYAQGGRHDYVLASRIEGPNVFLNSISDDSYGVSEPHHRWSTGTLFDNIYNTGSLRLGNIQAINRGKEGTGHGWSGATTIIWNALSPAILVGKPYTEQNFAVGVYGIYTDANKTPFLNVYIQNMNRINPTVVTPNYPSTKTFDGSPMYGNGYIEAAYNPANPSSLYRAQLSYRLYGDATKNVVPNAPILNYPATDEKFESYSVEFSGVADINADKVFVYVDGEKHQAEFTGDGNNYSLKLDLVNGYHDVYVTQEINGVESDRNAIRTFLVNSKVPYVPETGDKQETTKPADTTDPTETTDPNAGSDDDNKTPDDNKNGNNLVLPIVIIAACVVVGAVVFFVVKKTKKSK